MAAYVLRVLDCTYSVLVTLGNVAQSWLVVVEFYVWKLNFNVEEYSEKFRVFWTGSRSISYRRTVRAFPGTVPLNRPAPGAIPEPVRYLGPGTLPDQS